MGTQVEQGQVIHRSRVESPLRWEKALGRAIEANLSYIELIGGDGAFAVSSSRDDEQGYIATVHTCTCAAGRGDDPVCLHRALVRVLTGMMPVDAESVTDCPNCTGCGIVVYRSGNQEPCPDCGGSGTKQERRLHDAPSIRPVAA